MSYTRRRPVNKRRSVKSFRRHAGKTKAGNMKMPMRGGWRL